MINNHNHNKNNNKIKIVNNQFKQIINKIWQLLKNNQINKRLLMNKKIKIKKETLINKKNYNEIIIDLKS